MTYTITRNTEFNSLEIFFDAKPSDAIRDALKALKFRWHSVKKCWYGYAEKEAAEEAIKAAGSAEEEKPEAFKAFTIHSPGYLGAVEVTGNNRQKFDGTSECFKKAFRACGISGVTVKKESFSGGREFTFTVTLEKSEIKTFEEFCDDFDVIDALRDRIGYLDQSGEYKEILGDDFYKMEDQEIVVDGMKRLMYKKAFVDRFESPFSEKNSGLSEAGKNKMKRIHQIVMSFFHDNSNAMVDYFETNFYYTYAFKIKD